MRSQQGRYSAISHLMHWKFLVIYFGSVIGGNLLSLYVHRHHHYFAYGASGGVCGIIFAHILLFPGSHIGTFFLSISIPGWLYAICFMLYSFFGMKENNRGGIGHDAHLGGSIVGLLIAAAMDPESVRRNLLIFLIVLISALLLLCYLWFNSLFLPLRSFITRRTKSGLRNSKLPPHKRENLQVDAVLEKIARSGIESLTDREKALLDDVSDKYRRRAESKKPDSGLAIWKFGRSSRSKIPLFSSRSGSFVCRSLGITGVCENTSNSRSERDCVLAVRLLI